MQISTFELGLEERCYGLLLSYHVARCSHNVFNQLVPVFRGKLIDLSHAYNSNTQVWGTNTAYQHTIVHEGPVSDEVPYLLLYDISLSEHCGTHIDAPVHFAKGKWSVDQIPPEKLVAPVIVVNISEKAAKDRNALLTVGDLESWERSYGRIPDNCVLLVYSGWDSYWTDIGKYFGTDTKNASLYEFPGKTTVHDLAKIDHVLSILLCLLFVINITLYLSENLTSFLQNAGCGYAL